MSRRATLVLSLLLAACAGERPLLEQFRQGAWQPEALRIASFAGQRDGTKVTFSLDLRGEGGRRLVVEGSLEIDPQARLAEGRWSEEAGGAPIRSGEVSATGVEFLGGQGGRPALGGRFDLTAAQAPVYRLNLPPTVLRQP